MLRQFFIYALNNPFPRDDAMSAEEKSAAAWFRMIVQAFGACMAVAHPRYGVMATTAEMVAQLFPWLESHQTKALGAAVGGCFQSLQSILTNHPGWQDLFESWKRFIQVGYASAPKMDELENLAFKILDKLDDTTGHCAVSWPTLTSEMDEGGVAKIFWADLEHLFAELAKEFPAWRQQRKGAEASHNTLALRIIDRWTNGALTYYKQDAAGEAGEISCMLFTFMLECLQFCDGELKDKLTEKLSQRMAISTESSHLGVLQDRVSKPLSKQSEVDAFLFVFL